MTITTAERAAGRMTWVALALSGWLVALLIGGYMLLHHDGRSAIDLRGYVENPSPYAPGARIATDELCDADRPCIHAVDSDTLTMRRFESAEQAAAAASTLGGDVRLSGWIVVNFEPGRLSEEERGEFMAAQYCDHVGYDPC